MDTPSLVMVGAPNFFSITTLRPLGPRVTFTVSASLLTPASSPRRADSSNFRILGMTVSNSSRVLESQVEQKGGRRAGPDCTGAAGCQIHVAEEIRRSWPGCRGRTG